MVSTENLKQIILHECFLHILKGYCIKTQLSARKEVKLNLLGKFTLSAENDPVFIMSKELSQYKLKQKANIPPDNLSMS